MPGPSDRPVAPYLGDNGLHMRVERTPVPVHISDDAVAESQTELREGVLYEKGKGTPFTGMSVSHFASGRPQSAINWVGGRMQGTATDWHENGVVKEQCGWYRGEPSGSFRQWDEAGHLVRHGDWASGEWTTWDSAGHPVDREIMPSKRCRARERHTPQLKADFGQANLTADTVDMDVETGTALFMGNVRVDTPEYEIHADRAERPIHAAVSASSVMRLIGNVTVKDKTTDRLTRHDRLELVPTQQEPTPAGSPP